MGNDASGKDKSGGLGRSINGTEKAATAEACPAVCFVDMHLPHAGKIDHQAVFAAAESGKTVATAADSGKYSCGPRRADHRLHIRHSGAAGDQSRLAGNHAVPYAACFVKFGVAGTQQVSVELTA